MLVISKIHLNFTVIMLNFMGVSENSVPLNPMVFMIIIPFSKMAISLEIYPIQTNPIGNMVFKMSLGSDFTRGKWGFFWWKRWGFQWFWTILDGRYTWMWSLSGNLMVVVAGGGGGALSDRVLAGKFRRTEGSRLLDLSWLKKSWENHHF